MHRFFAIHGLFIVLGCTQAPPAKTPVESRAVTSSALVTSLEVEIGRDSSIGLVLHVTNPGTQPIVLEFNTAQRYDFEVRSAAGDAVWRWSSDQLFAQMMGNETIPAGASREYRERWRPGNRTGGFVAIGRVVATNQPVEQRANFEIRVR